jgi:hypothetical protein
MNGTAAGVDRTFKTRGLPSAGPPVTPAPGVKRIRCIVPKLRGRRLRGARKALRKGHCKLGRVTRRKARRRLRGRVIRQRPRAGAKRRRGFKVAVVVGR